MTPVEEAELLALKERLLKMEVKQTFAKGFIAGIVSVGSLIGFLISTFAHKLFP